VRQCCPCQRSTNVLAAPPPSGRATPTAHTSDPEAADTPKSSLDSCALAGPISTRQPSRQPCTAPAPPVHDTSRNEARTRAPEAHRRLHPVLTEAPPGTSGQVPSHFLSLVALTARYSTVQIHPDERYHERRQQEERGGRVDRGRERPAREVVDLHRERLGAGTARQVRNGDEVVDGIGEYQGEADQDGGIQHGQQNPANRLCRGCAQIRGRFLVFLAD